jgi:hypothetical protein
LSSQISSLAELRFFCKADFLRDSSNKLDIG